MTESASDGWPEEDQPIHLIKLRVRCADGKNRGGFFRDNLSNPHRWPTTVRQGLQEVMVCSGEMETGSWYLIEYVVPRRITGEKARDSLYDQASRCCCRMPVQALFWFTQQAIGSPPMLVDRVRCFAEQWRTFCSSSSAKDLLKRLLNTFVDADHEMFVGQGRSDLTLLRDIDLAVESRSPPKFSAGSIVQEMGIDCYITWMNGHLARVADLLDRADHSTGLSSNDPNARQLPEKQGDGFIFTPSSAASVTAIVRAVAGLRKSTPDITPKKERIKEKAGRTGGAGDRAVARAINLRLITVDYVVTEMGRQFLAERS